MKKPKVYAVRKGRKTGIFKTWPECQRQVTGYPAAEFKSFESMDEAKAYLKNGSADVKLTRGRKDVDPWTQRIQADQKAGILVAFTDGSYEHKLKKYAFGAVLLTPDGEEHTLRGSGNDLQYVESRNIPGEVLGVLNALDWAKKHGYDRIKVYHDYQGLAAWAKGEWQTKTPISIMYKKEFDNKANGMKVEFVKVPAHSNVELNEYVDKLAKYALREPLCPCREGGQLDELGESD